MPFMPKAHSTPHIDRVHYHDQREPEHNTSYLDPNNVLQAS